MAVVPLLLQGLATACEAILTILAVVAALVSIWVSIICCQAVGCCAPPQAVSIHFAAWLVKTAAHINELLKLVL
jgi:hypothetical protein